MSDQETDRLRDQTRARVIEMQALCGDIKAATSDAQEIDWLWVLDRLARISHESETMGHLVLRYAQERGLIEDATG